MKIPFHNHSMKGESQRFELNGGRHTIFLILKCWCGQKQAFPNDNLSIAIKEGTKKTLNRLKRLGLI